uniref:Uncharacterized protein n=1 Tax=Anguilla anguilla TaxID=7936 RepID=A0A0E9VVY1_ANGAN
MAVALGSCRFIIGLLTVYSAAIRRSSASSDVRWWLARQHLRICRPPQKPGQSLWKVGMDFQM